MRPAGRVNPFGDIDPNRYVAGGLAVAPDGAVLYDVLGLAGGSGGLDRGVAGPRRAGGRRRDARRLRDARAGRAGRDGPVRRDRSPRATGRGRRRRTPFRRRRPAARSGPGSTSSRPSRRTARSTRSAGRISNDRYSYLVAVHPDLTPAWAASLRGILTTAAACCSTTTTRTSAVARAPTSASIRRPTTGPPAGCGTRARPRRSCCRTAPS